MKLRETDYDTGTGRRVRYIVGPIEPARARLAATMATHKGATLVWEGVDHNNGRATFAVQLPDGANQ